MPVRHTPAHSPARRQFLRDSALAGGGLALGMALPSVADAAEGSSIPGELNVWVLIKPDDSTTIRIARTEMGQGTLTGLAQLVAEDLDADWSKVTTENITAGRNFAAKRAWGEMGTGGSRGIRSSQQYEIGRAHV